jgi:hypothetical protein
MIEKNENYLLLMTSKEMLTAPISSLFKDYQDYCRYKNKKVPQEKTQRNINKAINLYIEQLSTLIEGARDETVLALKAPNTALIEDIETENKLKINSLDDLKLIGIYTNGNKISSMNAQRSTTNLYEIIKKHYAEEKLEPIKIQELKKSYKNNLNELEK